MAPDDAPGNVRAIVEAQVMAMYRHSGWAGHRPRRVVVTAGGSENKGLLHVVAQVFGTSVRTFEVKESAALGSALRAAHYCQNRNGFPVTWKSIAEPFLAGGSGNLVEPEPSQAAVCRGRNGLLEIHEACEFFFLGQGADPAEKIRAFQKRISNSF